MIFAARVIVPVCVSENLPVLIPIKKISARSRGNHGYFAEISPISMITVISE